MAQTGDIKFGKTDSKDFNLSLVGTGGSELPNVDAEFSTLHMREAHCLLQDLLILTVLIVNFLFALNPRHI